jgi:hypothetical protein
MSMLEDRGFQYICSAEIAPTSAVGAVETPMSSFGWRLLMPFAFLGIAVGAIVVHENAIEKEALETALFEIGRGNSAKALDVLYRATGRKLEKKAKIVARSDEDGLDAVQELFVPGGEIERRLRQVASGELPRERFITKVYGDLLNKVSAVRTQELPKKLTSEEDVPFTDAETLEHWKSSIAPIWISGVRYAPVPELKDDGTTVVRFTSAEGKVGLTRSYKRPVHKAPKAKLILPMVQTEFEVGDRYREHLESLVDLERVLRQIGIPDTEIAAATTEYGDVRKKAIAMLLSRDPKLSEKRAATMVDKQVEDLRSDLMSQLGREGDLSREDLESAKLYLRLGERAKKYRDPKLSAHYLRWAKNIREAFDRRLGEFASDRAERIAKRLNAEEDVRRRQEDVIARREIAAREGHKFYGPLREEEVGGTFDLAPKSAMTPEERKRVARKIAERLHEKEEMLLTIDKAIEANADLARPEVSRLNDLRVAFEEASRLPKDGHIYFEGAHISRAKALKKIQRAIASTQDKIAEIGNLVHGLELRKPKIEQEWMSLDAQLPDEDREQIESLQRGYRKSLNEIKG